MVVLLAGIALAAPADDVYLEALDAWNHRDWYTALTRSEDALAIDSEHAPARLLHGYALVRMRAWERGVGELRPLLDDPYVGARARAVVRKHDNRWRRDAVAVSTGFVLRDDRDAGNRVWVGGWSLAVDVPIIPALSVRADAVTPWVTYDALDVYGPVVSVVGVAHHTFGTWGVEAGIGPSLWLGRSDFWEGAFGGPFPGLRVSAGGDHRLLRHVGVRLEAGYTQHWAGRGGLGVSSFGWDFRLMGIAYAW